MDAWKRNICQNKTDEEVYSIQWINEWKMNTFNIQAIYSYKAMVNFEVSHNILNVRNIYQHFGERNLALERKISFTPSRDVEQKSLINPKHKRF